MAQIRLWIVALSHVVSRLERTHASLVHAIVNMPWNILDNATVKSYTIFIGMLLSAKPEYLSSVLSMIAQGFTYREHLFPLPLVLPIANIDFQNQVCKLSTLAYQNLQGLPSREGLYTTVYMIFSDIFFPLYQHYHPVYKFPSSCIFHINDRTKSLKQLTYAIY